MTDSFVEHRNLWIANLEVVLQAQRTPALRTWLADGQRQARTGMAAMVRNVPADTVDEATARSLGSVQMALIGGIVTQWLTDPDSASSAAEIVEGLRRLAGAAQAPASSP